MESQNKVMHGDGRRVLFYVPDGNLLTNGVYASQVGGIKRYLEGMGVKTMVFQDAIRNRMKFFQVIPYFKREARKHPELIAFKPTHIYVRTFASCVAARELADVIGAKLIYSMRGVDIEEAKLSGGLRGFVLSMYARWGVRKALRCADHVNVVSHTMKEWLRRNYNVAASVLPCCVEDKAFVPLGAEREGPFMVVYCGGLSKWQKIDDIIALMKRIGEADRTLRFRFLTGDINALKNKCEQLGLSDKRWSVKACRQDEVPIELAKADVGIILRDDNVVNRVASPIKIGEYLAAGLGMIVSPCVGDAGHDLEGKSFAKVWDGGAVDDLVSFINSVSGSVRLEAQLFAKQHFTYEGNHKAVEEMFA